jgi:hypothetical protein
VPHERAAVAAWDAGGCPQVMGAVHLRLGMRATLLGRLVAAASGAHGGPLGSTAASMRLVKSQLPLG